MSNGGLDCCGVCWFNSNNGGKQGQHNVENGDETTCVIRNIKIQDQMLRTIQLLEYNGRLKKIKKGKSNGYKTIY